MSKKIIRVLGILVALALGMPRVVKRLAVLLVDLFLCVTATLLAFYLRLGDWVSISGPLASAIFVSILLAIPIFIISGLYKAIFRYSGMPAMMTMVRAMCWYGLLFVCVFALGGVDGVPRTVGLIQPILLLLMVGASRAVARVWLGGVHLKQLSKTNLPKALIYGAGSAGRQLALAMASSHEIHVVGFLDDDERLHGHVLNGLPIHNPQNLAVLLRGSKISDILLALPSVPSRRRNEVLAKLKPYKLAVRTLPGLSDLATGKVSFSDVRELDINDLLGREPVQPSDLLLSLSLRNKTVLVTGAGGSIGSELCRQILKGGPKQLLIFDMSEYALYQLNQELLSKVADDTSVSDFDEREGGLARHKQSRLYVKIIPLLGSVCDERRVEEIMRTWQPDTVYHTAAYKHVPLVECNPLEGVRNNVWGTRVCAEAAARNGVDNFILVSTDKAVRPTNVMGATKRLSEMVLQSLADLKPKTCFSMVRFGNVLGSSGSVVPLFRKQIKSGGPITLTDERITRYFMTIPEAAQLVIQAGAMAIGGDVFVLDMGEPVKIIDLARRMVELAGLTVKDDANPDGDIEIQVTGLRPGEKLYEELLIGDNPLSTDHSRIMKAHEDFLVWSELEVKMSGLMRALEANDVPLLKGLLKDLVPGYQPDGNITDWGWLAREKEKNV